MKKPKFLSLLLVFVLLLTCSVNTSTEVLAISGDPTITVGVAEGNPGDEVTITVALSNNPGICSIRLAISYNSNLTLTAVENGNIMSDNVFGKQLTANPYYVTWDESLGENDNTKNGTLVTLMFKISESTKAGDYPVSVSYRSGEIYNLDLDDVDFDIVNGKVIVKSASAPVPVTSIELDKTETDFDKGDTVQISATVLPANATDKTLTWESSDESIATVDSNGFVTGVTNGTATITAKSKDGTVQATCTVTINCIHDSKTTHTEKESTCVEQGNDTYYTCDDCGKFFDADGVTELEVPPFRPLGNHTGGTATCTDLAVCSVCGRTYGDYGVHRYTAQTESEEALKTAGTCSEKAVYYYSCSVCGACEHNDAHVFYGEKDTTIHDGETEIRNAKVATCCENGYTGDTYCKDCNAKIASGSAIPATGNHVDADGKWETNGTQHWHTCYYGTQFDVASHTGGKATCTEKAKCSVCGVEYGEYGAHGETEIKNAKEATCCENGYTGDTHCKDCDAKLSSGSVIPATGHHTDADGKWETNGTKHWHTCYYGTQFDVASHAGGTATCTEKAKCSVCGAEYGDYVEHALTHHDRVEPDYERDGNIEYWTCDDCGKYFADSEGQNEINATDVIIAKLTVTEYQFLDGEVIIEAPSGSIPKGSLFNVQKIVPPPEEIVEKVKDQLGSSSTVLAYYEVRLVDTDGTLIIHLDGEITIKVKMPEQYVGNKCVRVFQEDETGKLINMTSWWEGEYLCYKTDWLENYDD